MTQATGRKRVAPMAPDDRRAALIQATIPLVREFGMSVSTRQIADAAGVAEGTIFRVFPDKTALMIATVLQATAAPTAATLHSYVDMDADLRSRLIQVTEMLTNGMRSLGRVVEAMRSLMSHPDAHEDIHAQMKQNRQNTLDSLAAVIEPDRDRLRLSPRHGARIIMMMIFSANAGFGDADALTSSEVVSVILDGLLIPNTDIPNTDIPNTDTATGDPTC